MNETIDTVIRMAAEALKEKSEREPQNADYYKSRIARLESFASSLKNGPAVVKTPYGLAVLGIDLDKYNAIPDGAIFTIKEAP